MAQAPLLLIRGGEARTERGVFGDGARPPLDPAGGLHARQRSDEGGAGQVVGRRERRAIGGVRRLLRYRRSSERTAASHTNKGARRASELLLDQRAVIHLPRSVAIGRAGGRGQRASGRFP